MERADWEKLRTRSEEQLRGDLSSSFGEHCLASITAGIQALIAGQKELLAVMKDLVERQAMVVTNLVEMPAPHRIGGRKNGK